MKFLDRLFRSLYWRLRLREQHAMLEQLNQKLDFLIEGRMEHAEDSLYGRHVIDRSGYPVAFVADGAYLDCTLVAIYSLCHHAAPDTRYRVFLVLSACDSDKRNYVESLFPGIEIISHDAMNVRYEKHDHVSKTAFEKFDLPQLLPEDVDRVLYLDGDIVVRHDLSDLFAMDLKDAYAGVVLEMTVEIDRYACRIGMRHPEGYFNSGVMYLNMKKLREDGCTEKLYGLQMAHPEFRYYDQDCFNVVFEGNVMRLPLRFNLTTAMDVALDYDLEQSVKLMGEDESVLRNSIRNPSIMHYAGGYKPWQVMCGQCALWWKYEAGLLEKMKEKIAGGTTAYAVRRLSSGKPGSIKNGQ